MDFFIMILLVGKFGLGKIFIKLVIVVLGLFINRWIVEMIFVKLCGGMFVVILIVILVVLLMSKFGKCVGKIVGFCFVLL